ncbi:hypothetical protein [Corynebacterium stationis]|uniref:hypothetical protein n=1 Tax=Corynebacterium stationis TaxID=1705 RepID=UPI00076F63E0|nr:hypothetical protein [Corynebacterium stationis]AMJ44211.1 hypothetical protein AW169_04285 [Corynebacterium stationis]AQX70671.1 hypothetical protein CA21670_03455 [Corynebacterium stationis]ASJ18360.1 hypothetical protein BA700_04285 [Corynebacterium stationis]
MLSMIPIGINIEDIQYVGSSVLDWGVDLAIWLYEAFGAVGSATFGSSDPAGGIDIPKPI